MGSASSRDNVPVGTAASRSQSRRSSRALKKWTPRSRGLTYPLLIDDRTQIYPRVECRRSRLYQPIDILYESSGKPSAGGPIRGLSSTYLRQLTRTLVSLMMHLMWFSRQFRSVTASCLIALVCALSTGVPSHHHERPDDSHGTVHVIGPDHHSHGTILVEQAERVSSSPPQLIAVVASGSEPIPAAVSSVVQQRREPIRPRERAPPPNNAPRAPPHLS